jgi:hypothetical protein
MHSTGATQFGFHMQFQTPVPGLNNYGSNGGLINGETTTDSDYAYANTPAGTYSGTGSLTSNLSSTPLTFPITITVITPTPTPTP